MVLLLVCGYCYVCCLVLLIVLVWLVACKFDYDCFGVMFYGVANT